MITIVMTTYFPNSTAGQARRQYAYRCIDSLKLLTAPEALRLHRADDGSDLLFDSRPALDLCEYWETHYTSTDSRHRGIGASLNLALLNIDDLWLYTTDDWLLTQELDLRGPVKLLRDREYDLVRLGPIHPGLTCVTRFEQGLGWWLDLQAHYGGFAFATRPFIATKQFYNKMGPFDEYPGSYETERLYAERVAKVPCKLAYWGGIDLAGPWEHIGLVGVGSE